jgi:hypothetical protein
MDSDPDPTLKLGEVKGKSVPVHDRVTERFLNFSKLLL